MEKKINFAQSGKQKTLDLQNSPNDFYRSIVNDKGQITFNPITMMNISWVKLSNSEKVYLGYIDADACLKDGTPVLIDIDGFVRLGKTFGQGAKLMLSKIGFAKAMSFNGDANKIEKALAVNEDGSLNLSYEDVSMLDKPIQITVTHDDSIDALTDAFKIYHGIVGGN